jgi:hypothetical protein
MYGADQLLALLATQEPDGHFGWSATLAELLRIDDDAIPAMAADPVWTTTCVLELLDDVYPDRRDEWRGAALKARRFVHLAMRGV